MQNPTSDEEEKSVDKIFEMLDLFYANKHMYDKLRARDKKIELDIQLMQLLLHKAL